MGILLPNTTVWKITRLYNRVIQKLCYCSVAQLCLTLLRFHGLQHHGNQAFWSFTISWSLLKLISTESVILTIDLILCHILLLPSKLHSIRIFSNDLAVHSGSQSIGASASALVFPMNIQSWFPLWLIGLISLQSKRLSRVLSNTTIQKHQFFGAQISLWSNSHNQTWLLEKP